MKVVSQLKRTLSTVLALMMVFTSVPAMPVLADEIVEIPAIEAAAEEVAVVDAVVEDAAEVILTDGTEEPVNEVLEVSYPASKVIVATKKKSGADVSKKITYKAATTTLTEGVSGNRVTTKVAAVYSVSGNDAATINSKTGKITLAEDAVKAGKDVVLTVTAKKADETDMVATTTITFALKESYTAEAPIIATISENGNFVKCADITDKNAKVEPSDKVDYVVVVPTVSGNKAEYTPSEVAPVNDFTYKFSSYKNLKIDFDAEYPTFKVAKKSTTTITVAAKGYKYKKAIKVYAKDVPLDASKLVLNIATAFDNEGNITDCISVSANSTTAEKPISVNGIMSDILVTRWSMNSEELCQKGITRYTFKPSLSKAKATYVDQYGVDFVINEMSVGRGANKAYKANVAKITVKGAKIDGHPTKAEFYVTIDAPALPKNKLVQKKNTAILNNTKDAQKLELTTAAAISDNAIVAIWADQLAASKLKGAKSKAYWALFDQITGGNVATISGNAATVAIDRKAVEGIQAGTYSFKVYTCDPDTCELTTAPTTLKVKVKNQAVKKAVVDLQTKTVQISKNSVSGNKAKNDLGFKAPGTKKVSANDIKLVKVNNAYFKGGEGYTNKFTENFDVVLENNTFKVYQLCSKDDLNALTSKDKVGFITYKAPATYNEDMTVRTYVTKTVKITIKLTNN